MKKCCPRGDSNLALPVCQSSTVPLSHGSPAFQMRPKLILTTPSLFLSGPRWPRGPGRINCSAVTRLTKALSVPLFLFLDGLIAIQSGLQLVRLGIEKPYVKVSRNRLIYLCYGSRSLFTSGHIYF